mgnify:CR=1 FL=1
MDSNSNFLTKIEHKTLQKDYLKKLLPSSIIFLFLFLINFTISGLNKTFGLFFYLITSISFVISAVLFYFLTRNHRLDLKEKKVLMNKTIVEDKVYKLDYEAGSATVPVNLLSLLFFKKIFLREMKELHFYYIQVKEGTIYLKKDEYEKIEIGDEIYIRRARNTNLFLGIEIIKPSSSIENKMEISQ